jgi:plastocyanin
MKKKLHVSAFGLAIALASAATAPTLAADETHIPISIKGHRFDPAEPTAPAGKPVVFEVSNRDGTPAEFESKALRVEKVVPGGGTVMVKVRALQPGRYRFYDDYHEESTVGFLVVQ